MGTRLRHPGQPWPLATCFSRVARHFGIRIMRNATSLRPQAQRKQRSPAAVKTLERERAEWLARIKPESLFQRLFDYLPGVYFFAKDRRGRTMFVSRGILNRYRMTSESEMLGLTDFDINPGSMARTYVADDRRLLAGEIPRVERLELWFDDQGVPDWFMVTKLPLIDVRGRPQGVMGILRQTEEHERRLPVFQTVALAVEIIRKNHGQSLIVAELARQCGQSPRQLQRRFAAAFGLTPQEFIIRTRVMSAARLLEVSTLSAAEISRRCGFISQSAFTQQFRARTGSTPLAYRHLRKAPSGGKP